MNILDSQAIEIPCPHCHSQCSETVAKLRANPNLTCRGCGNRFKVDASALTQAAKKVDKHLADIQRALGRLR